MKDEQLNVLKSLDKNSLMLLKEEAESFLQNQAESEGIIINKANNLFQIMVGVFISILGYLIKDIDSNDNIQLYNSGIIFACFLGSATICSFISVYPRKVYLKGSVPENVLDKDIFSGSQYDIEKFLKNRIYCINSDISKNEKSQRIRIRYYTTSIVIIFCGITVVVFNSFL